MSIIVSLFPVWAVLFSVAAYYLPDNFAIYKSFIIPLLAVVMFGMGMTLTWDSFRKVFADLRLIGMGVLAQFLVMPLAAYLIAKLFNLPTALLAGMILVGSSPGGTASNVICYLAKGEVALSITLTMVPYWR